jgi:hypothetical protein
MEITGETFRGLSREFGYSEDALSRHKANHLMVDLNDVRQTMAKAREETLRAIKAEEMEEIKGKMKESMAARLENAASFLDQLREVRSKSASLLDQAEKAQDLRAAGTFLKELREQIKLWAELEGKLSSQPQVNVLISPQWVELRTAIIESLEPFPAAREAVIRAMP